MNPLELIDHKITAYFEALGYRASWNSSIRYDDPWYEISDEKGLICQFDMGVKLADIVEDFTAWHKNIEATSKSDYIVNVEKGSRIDLLLERVAKKGLT